MMQPRIDMVLATRVATMNHIADENEDENDLRFMEGFPLWSSK
ncbi:MAG: hypothetical protein QOG17_1518 [Gammaproteobacteria bacterium]|nr:hypothetical protein [Gammaproteobacteria bacterium]